MLSSRGEQSIKPLPIYLKVSFATFSNPYTVDNPTGYLNLSIAENRLSLPELASQIHKAPDIPPSSLTYDWMHGTIPFRTAVANLFTRSITHRPVSPHQIVTACGAGAIIDLLATVVCDPLDAVLVTGPGYSGFERDLDGRAGVRIVVAKLDEEEGKPWPVMSVNALQTAWDREEEERAKRERDGLEGGGRIRAVMVCSPGNPTGEVLSAGMVKDIVDWGRGKGIHVIFDEVYALSVYKGGERFVSVGEVLDGNLGDDVHIIWSFSKDFCVSGLRIGVLYTQNTRVMECLVPLLTYFTSVSRGSQWAMRHVIDDVEFVEGFVERNSERLREGYEMFTSALSELGVPFMQASAGFFVWIDLRAFMDGDDAEAEMRLWERIVEEGRVLLTPASQCFGSRAGYFRACFAAVSADELRVACERLAGVLKGA